MRMDERIARIEDNRRRADAAAADPQAMSDMPLSLNDRLAAVEAKRDPVRPFVVVQRPAWQLLTEADGAAWDREHVEPLRDRYGLVVIVDRLSPPVAPHL